MWTYFHVHVCKCRCARLIHECLKSTVHECMRSPCLSCSKLEKTGLCFGSEQQIDILSPVGEVVNHLSLILIAHNKTALRNSSTALRVKVKWTKCCRSQTVSRFNSCEEIFRINVRVCMTVREWLPSQCLPLLWGHDVPATLQCLYSSVRPEVQPTNWPRHISWGHSSPALYRIAWVGPWPPIVYVHSALSMLLW